MMRKRIKNAYRQAKTLLDEAAKIESMEKEEVGGGMWTLILVAVHMSELEHLHN
jgi:hypothetical protein